LVPMASRGSKELSTTEVTTLCQRLWPRLNNDESLSVWTSNLLLRRLQDNLVYRLLAYRRSSSNSETNNLYYSRDSKPSRR
jgi:hypothetical protein